MEPMKIAMLEDDIHEVENFKNILINRSEFDLINATNSVDDVLYYATNSLVEGIVVDIELNKGIGGSGLDFLKRLENENINTKPLLIVTTHNESDAVYNACRDLRVDMIYYKSKVDYDIEMVLNQFLTLRPYIEKMSSKTPKILIEEKLKFEKRVEEVVKLELDSIGIPVNLLGREYITKAIMHLVFNEKNNKGKVYFTNYLEKLYGKRKGAISTTMQDAINAAWRKTPEEELIRLYKAPIDFEKGTPTPSQFIHYYSAIILKKT